MSVRGRSARADFAGAASANRDDFDWLAAHRADLESTLALSVRAREYDVLIDLWRAVDTWFSLTGRWADLKRFRAPAERAAKRLDRPTELAEMLISEADLRDLAGDGIGARALMTEALRQAHRADDPLVLAQATDRLGVLTENPSLVADAWELAKELPAGAVPAYVAYDYAGLHPEEEAEFLAKALDIVRQAPMSLEVRRAEAFVLTAQAFAAGEQGQHRAAEELARRALALKRGIGDRPSTANSLIVLAGITSQRGFLEEAASAAAEARDIFVDLGLLDRAADAAHQLGRVLEEKRNWKQAEGAYEQAISWYGSGRPMRSGLAWRDIGDVRRAAGDRARAIEAYERGFELLRGAADPADLARVLLAAAVGEAGRDRDRARTWAAEAEDLAEAVGDPRILGEALYVSGSLSIDEALAGFKLQRSLRFLEQTPAVGHERLTVATALVRALRSWQTRARSAFERELASNREDVERPKTAIDATEAADILTTAGELEGAERLLGRARRLKAPPERLRASGHALGRAFESDGNLPAATRLYRQTLRSTPKDDPQMRGVVLHDLADVYRASGETARALRTYREAARWKGRATNLVDQARTQRRIAELALELEDRTMARRATRQARRLLSEAGPDSGERSLRSALDRLDHELASS